MDAVEKGGIGVQRMADTSSRILAWRERAKKPDAEMGGVRMPRLAVGVEGGRRIPRISSEATVTATYAANIRMPKSNRSHGKGAHMFS